MQTVELIGLVRAACVWKKGENSGPWFGGLKRGGPLGSDCGGLRQRAPQCSPGIQIHHPRPPHGIGGGRWRCYSSQGLPSSS